MKPNQPRWTFLIALAIAASVLTGANAFAAPTVKEHPPAPIENDAGGPQRLVGSLDYTDFSLETTLQDPSPALLDIVHVVAGDGTQFAPVESQILGNLTSSAYPPLLSYAFNLPAVPVVRMATSSSSSRDG